MGKTLFEKIWEKHIVKEIDKGPSVLYIDRHYIHEVTSPQAFEGLKNRGLRVFRPQQVTACPDHNIPTRNQDQPIREPMSRAQVEALKRNCQEQAIHLYELGTPYQGIIHVMGPELGETRPGMTIVCGDSHTSTHGAFGSIAFGIGTSEVEMVLATQCLLQSRPKLMRISVEGKLKKGVLSKDIILYIISQITTSGATGYFVEFSGSTIHSLSMEARMTICNMSIEMGARGGMIAPDQITFDYMKGRPKVPSGKAWEEEMQKWEQLYSDEDAVFDKEITFNAEDITPMVTYGTNPAMGIPVTGTIPFASSFPEKDRESYSKALQYMGFKEGENIKGHPIDYVFIGSCTNSRIEDLRIVASYVKGKTKAPDVKVWIVPGSRQVEKIAREEGLDKIFKEAGFEFRQPGCSACLAMNDDKIPAGKTCVSTSNRNFEGRQGAGARTILASPLSAAAAAISGNISDFRDIA